MFRLCIAGRPNVGKSTLFNRLYGRRLSITDSMPGVTRDVLAREIRIADRPVQLVDTGGVGAADDELLAHVHERSRNEIERADLVLVLVDVMGLSGEDEELIDFVRRSGRPVALVVNKVDNEQREALVSDFWSLGIEAVVPVSAAHGLGMDDLEAVIVAHLETYEARSGHSSAPESADDERGERTTVNLAIIGQPNTGKSSLLNWLIGEDRAIVSDIAGTTRDSVEARFQHRGTDFSVVDTAGIRRRTRVNQNVEYYAVQRAFDAIDAADLAILMIDATKGLSDQDKKIAARLTQTGRGTVVALNKWDLLDDTGNQLNAMTDRIHFAFPVFQHVPILPISAHTGEGIPELLKRLLHIRSELQRRIETGPLNQALKRWLLETPPPSGKRPIKLRYMTQVQSDPVRFVLFVNRVKGFPEFYERYIRNRIREDLGFAHIPFFLELRES